jgi:hypothetical protein
MKKKSTKAKAAKRKPANPDQFRDIPEDEQKAVAMVWGLRHLYFGNKVTPKDVYVGMVQDKIDDERKRQKKEQERAKEMAAEVRASSREALKSCLRRLAESRDALRHIETDPDDEVANDTMVRLVRLDIEDAGKQLEQALFNLGLISGAGFDCSGWFMDTLKSEMPQEAEVQS